MKNRKTVVVAFMLCAVMLLGVGYAALIDTLTLSGNVEIDFKQAENIFDERVYFLSGEYIDTVPEGKNPASGDQTKDTITASADLASFGIQSLASVGEARVMKFVIQNDSNVAAKITFAETQTNNEKNPYNSNPDVFDITYEYDKADMIIPSKGSMTVTVTVVVKVPVTESTHGGGAFSIEFKANTVEE